MSLKLRIAKLNMLRQDRDKLENQLKHVNEAINALNIVIRDARLAKHGLNHMDELIANEEFLALDHIRQFGFNFPRSTFQYRMGIILKLDQWMIILIIGKALTALFF